MKRLLACLVLCFALLCVSCTHRMIDFTIISSKNVEPSKMNEYVRGDRAIGEDSGVMILIVPIGFPTIKGALDRAIEGTPGCVALLDGVVSSKVFMLPPFFARSAFIVEGTCLIDPSVKRNGPLKNNK